MNTASRLLRCACVLAALALAAGCEGPEARHPKATQECVLAPGQPAPDVELGIESSVRIVLPGPEPGSGMAWEIAENNARVLEQMGRPAAVPGARPAASTVSFYSLKPGRSVIRFVLIRPGQREAEPAAMCGVVVHVRD